MGEEEQKRTAEYKKPFFIKQTVRNACGTMGLLHALTNVEGQCGGYRTDSFMARLTTEYSAGKEKGTPEARGQFLNEDKDLEEVH